MSPFKIRNVLKSLLVLMTFTIFGAGLAQANPVQDQARRLFERLNGHQPTLEQLSAMMNEMSAGRVDQAAMIAINSPTYGFYRNTLVDTFDKLTNLEGVRGSGLNAVTATVVGLAKEGDFRDLFGDVIYASQPELSTYFVRFDPDGNGPQGSEIFEGNVDGNPLVRVRRGDGNGNPLTADGQDDPTKVRALLRATSGAAFNDTNIQFEMSDANTNPRSIHYSDLETIYPNTWPEKLVRYSQTEMWSVMQNGRRVPPEDVMGIVTLPQVAKTVFDMGTNRRPYKLIMKSFMCMDLEEFKDATAPDFRVRSDIPRSESYQTNCRSCHAQMDAMSGAFAYFDLDNDGGDAFQILHNVAGLEGNPTADDAAAGQFQKKQWRQWTNNLVFGLPQHLVRNNTWYNFVNAIDWRVPSTGESTEQGTGAANLGRVLAHSAQFSDCMARRAYERVCLDDLASNPNDSPQEAARKQAVLKSLNNLAREYEQGFSDLASYEAGSPYSLKALWAKAGATCFGGGN